MLSKALGGTPEPLPTTPSRQVTRPRVPRGYESVDSIVLTEPRIEAIRRQLQALLDVVQLEVDGKPVEIDGFRLRNIGDWADYTTSLSDIFWHMSSTCNFSCEFCYEKGNPPEFPIQNLTRMASPDELDTRLRHYDAATQRGIFSTRTAINEPFVNRNAVDYLPKLRQAAPDELISFVTNGSLLSERVVEILAGLNPVFFNLSLYSVDEQVRRNVLADRRPGNAVEAVRLLAKHEVPYMSNIVMWPSIPFEDMERTVRFLDENRAAVIRVCLGGYSQFLEGSFERFDSTVFWPTVVERVEALRSSVSAPILIEPNSFVDQTTDAVVAGVVVDSPAALGGLARGDVIVAVNGEEVLSRTHLSTLLRRTLSSRTTKYRQPGVVVATDSVKSDTPGSVQLAFERSGTRFEIHLDKYLVASMETYPYRKIADFKDFAYGLVISDALPYSSLKAARDIIVARGAKRTLLLTSTMVKPVLEHMLAKSAAFEGLDVEVVVAENLYFGGTICVGDLLVVSDFVAAIKANCASCRRSPPDLVLIPASPFASSAWGRDLTGRPWTDIERLSGVPVELVQCPTLTF